jgi:hypothetical protein
VGNSVVKVFFVRRPFKILQTIIEAVTVDVIYGALLSFVGLESCEDKSMNAVLGANTIFTECDGYIAIRQKSFFEIPRGASAFWVTPNMTCLCYGVFTLIPEYIFHSAIVPPHSDPLAKPEGA